LAPSNAAFNENPDLLTALFNPRNVEVVQELLLYHIAPGLFLTDDLLEGPLQTLLGDDVAVILNPLMFNQGVVSDRDVLACNSVIHVIDDLLIPPGKPLSLAC
jgi:transforming growth factor-beta-induced protein